MMLWTIFCCSAIMLLCLVEDSDAGIRRGEIALSANTCKNLMKIHNTTEFLTKFVKRPTMAQVSGMIATYDACEPKPTSVKIPQTDPSVLLWPTCTTLNRCGGCCGCSTGIHECTPVKKTTHSLSVLQCKRAQPGSEDFNVTGMQIMNFEEHLACECQCKVKADQCDRNKHNYLPHECRCQCRNEAEALNCRRPKKWDDRTCGCVCREVYNCHPDEQFSHTNCRCKIRSSSGDHSSGPCTRMTCLAGFVKQSYMGHCRCIISSSTLRPPTVCRQGRRPPGCRRIPRRRYPG